MVYFYPNGGERALGRRIQFFRGAVFGVLVWVSVVNSATKARAAGGPSEELIAKTQAEGKALARVVHEYRLKQKEIEDRGINLNDGTMLGGRYTYDLNAIQKRVEEAFARLQTRVRDETGSLEGSRELTEALAAYWSEELYGFATIDSLAEQLSKRRMIACLLVGLSALLISAIPRRIGEGEPSNTPPEVPKDLKHVVVPSMRYPVYLITGLVMDKEMWDEVKTTTIYEGAFGNRPVETQVQTKRKGKTYLLTQDGKEDILNLTGYGHNYRPGQIVTFVFYGKGKKRAALVAYNHATDRSEEMIGTDAAHGSRWIVNLLGTGTLAYYAFDWANAPLDSLGGIDSFWLAIQWMGLALATTYVSHVWRRWRRNRRFRKKYQPKLEAFLRSSDAAIGEAFKKLTGGAAS